MKITAITKFKNGELYHAIRKSGKTVKEIAKMSGISYSFLIGVLNLKTKPGKQTMFKLQFVFGELGIFLDLEKAFPKHFSPLKGSITIEQTKDIEPNLIQGPEEKLLEFPEWKLQECLKCLDPRELHVIKKRFFYTGDKRPTLDDLAGDLNVTKTRIGQIQSYAISKLRREMEKTGEYCRMVEELKEWRKV